MPGFSIPSLWTAREELEEVRGRYLLRLAKPQGRHRRHARRAQEPVPRFPLQEQLHPDTEEAKGFLLVQRAPRSTVSRCAGKGLEEGEDGPGGYHPRRQRACHVLRIRLVPVAV